MLRHSIFVAGRGKTSRLYNPSVLTPSVPLQTLNQVRCVTYRYKIKIDTRKPTWYGMEERNFFKLPLEDKTPKVEKEQIDLLYHQYYEHMSALTQYLYEDFLRVSDKGDITRIKEEKEAALHVQLIKENELENQRVAELRVERLKEEALDEEIRAVEIVKAKKVEEEKKLKETEAIIAREIESMAARVLPENLEEEIHKALDNPKDYEYCIDNEGHIYRGKYTKGLLVIRENREKIPQPPQIEDFIHSHKLLEDQQ